MKPPDYLQPLKLMFTNEANADNAIQMEKYMKNLFPFYGIKSPERKEIFRIFKNENGIIPVECKTEVVHWCWNASQREYQYFAMEFLRKSAKKEAKDIISLYEFMVMNKSWWDTVDFIASNLIGPYFLLYPELIESYTQKWMKSNNMWLQRTCLLFQLKYRSNTNIELIDSFISVLNNSKEFFIRKAIGWILREYSKTNPEFVLEYVKSKKLQPLSKREALLWLQRKENTNKNQPVSS